MRTFALISIGLTLIACSGDDDGNPTVPDCTEEWELSESSTFDVPPVPIYQVQPQYPEDARSNGQEGLVMVLVVIATNGNVCGAWVHSSDAAASLQHAAVQAAHAWLFEPATLEGTPVPVRIVLPFRFDLP